MHLRFAVLSFLLISSNAWANSEIVPSYSLCAIDHYDNIGITEIALRVELQRATERSKNMPYLQFQSERDGENFLVKKPIQESKRSLRQIGQQHYWICIEAISVSPIATAAEWCPKHEGKFPAALVDLGEYKLFYFVPDSIYSEQGQAATVYLTKAGKIMSVMTAEGGSDWFSSTEYKGERNGFSCDSISLDFEHAWFADENGKRNIFKQGEVRAPGYKRHELVCSEAPPKVAL